MIALLMKSNESIVSLGNLLNDFMKEGESLHLTAFGAGLWWPTGRKSDFTQFRLTNIGGR